MDTLNLIGLMLGYLGSISLAAGLIKSKQEVIDEERPFWGPNPFKMRTTLRSRLLGFFGLTLLVAGFATTIVATAFSTVFYVDDILLAIIVILLLIILALSVILLILHAKKAAHTQARNRYYFNQFIDTVRQLSKEKQDDTPESQHQDFETIRQHYLDGIAKYVNDLGTEDKQAHGRLVNSLQDAGDAEAIKKVLEDFLAEQDTQTSP